MKILVLSQHWFPENGVHQRRWSWLSELLIEAGHEVMVISPPPHYQRKIDFRTWAKSLLSPGVTLETGPSGEKIYRSVYLPAGRSLVVRALNQGVVAAGMLAAVIGKNRPVRRFQPDLVIGTVPAIPTSIVTPVVAKLLKSPYLIDLRDAWPDLLAERKEWNEGTGLKSSKLGSLASVPMKLLSALLTRLMNIAYERSKGMIVTSEHLADALKERFGAKNEHIEIVTIRNVFPPKTSYDARKIKNGANGTLNVLYAGTLGRAQKLSNALDAAKIAEVRGVKVNLRFVGAGVAKEELLRKIKKEKISASVYGHVQAHELRDHYDWADTALVHLTDWEPLERAIPSKTYELMASGIHITGVVGGETADLITDLGGGHVVPPEDPEALAALWVDLATNRGRLTVSEEGQKWVKEQRDQEVPRALFEFLDRIGIE